MFALRPTPVLVARRCCRSSARLARSFATSPALTASAAPSSTRCRALVYTQHGEPSQIIEGHSYDLPAPKPDQALLRMGLGSVNPADLNVLEGKYPSRPQKRDDIGFREPAYIGGNEGFAVIQHIPQGSKVAKDMGLKEGDWVVFGRPQMGTWRSHLIADVKDLIKVPRSKEGALTEVMGGCSVHYYQFLP